MGLIEDKLGNADAAQRHYRAAYDAADSDSLKQLVGLKIAAAPTNPPNDDDDDD